MRACSNASISAIPCSFPTASYRDRPWREISATTAMRSPSSPSSGDARAHLSVLVLVVSGNHDVAARTRSGFHRALSPGGAERGLRIVVATRRGLRRRPVAGAHVAGHLRLVHGLLPGLARRGGVGEEPVVLIESLPHVVPRAEVAGRGVALSRRSPGPAAAAGPSPAPRRRADRRGRRPCPRSGHVRDGHCPANDRRSARRGSVRICGHRDPKRTPTGAPDR